MTKEMKNHNMKILTTQQQPAVYATIGTDMHRWICNVIILWRICTTASTKSMMTMNHHNMVVHGFTIPLLHHHHYHHSRPTIKSTTTMLLRHATTLSSHMNDDDDNDQPDNNNNSVIQQQQRNDYNVVLYPSSVQNGDNAFDNYKVGHCRVHRYSDVSSSSSTTSSSTSTPTPSTNNNDGTTTEYVMWYHGRNTILQQQQQNNNNNNEQSNNEGMVLLPSLSTGRIGRATSRNGLVWVKDTIGSASEDIKGVALGLNADSWWSFDTYHIGLGCVLLPLSTPAVLSSDGVYIMYYMGGNGDISSLSDYVQENITTNSQQETSSVSSSSSSSSTTTMVRGMNMKIGVAISQDGISWGRVEGDDPSGACMVPYSIIDPNQKIYQSNPNIVEELYCAWPEVIVNMKPNTINESFMMYYSTMTKDTKQKVIAYAVSEDGFRWYKRGICLSPSTTTTTSTDNTNTNMNYDDENGCARCCVIQDALYDSTTMGWIQIPNMYTMYYEGISKCDHKHRIYMAKSMDMKQWIKIGMALNVGEHQNSWDHYGVGSPHCIRLDDGTCRMYYTGQGKDGSTAIGVAKLSSNQGGAPEWIREQSTITFSSI